MTKHSIFSIRSMAMVLSAIAIVFVFNSCGDKNAKRFKEAAMNLDNTTFTSDWEYDYWPDGGIRNIGLHLASLISLNDLEAMLPCPLYISGPHRNGEWDLYNENYGHYNPQAIQYLADLAKKVVGDKKFVAASKPLVDKYLYRQMHYMMVIHDVMYDDNLVEQEGREFIFDEVIENYGYSEVEQFILSSLYFEDINDDSYLYWNFNYEFFYFWARRWKDGTIDQFYNGLSTIYKAYYPDYSYATDKYFMMDYDEWDGDEFYETTYNCDLENDEPIANNERIKENDAVEMFRTAATNLDKTSLVLADEFDYWPECGIRVMGGHLFSLISLRTLNKMLPCDLYVSGPHHYNRWELGDPYDFGHYNPEAVSYLGKLAKKVVSDKTFVEKTKPLVDEYLKRQMLIMKGLYDGLNDKNVCADKQAVLDNIMALQGQTSYYWDSNIAGQFMENLDLEDGSYVYGNTGGMFLYFWARRNADGTMELFHDILETVYSAYYPN